MAGWPSAAARLIRRPSPRRLILRPSFSEYSSTKLRVVRFDDDMFSSAGMSISTLKCPELEMIAPSFISVEMLFGQHALVAGDGAEDVAEFGGVGHRHDAETVHHGFERFRRINFSDDTPRRRLRERGWQARDRTIRSPQPRTSIRREGNSSRG